PARDVSSGRAGSRANRLRSGCSSLRPTGAGPSAGEGAQGYSRDEVVRATSMPAGQGEIGYNNPSRRPTPEPPCSTSTPAPPPSRAPSPALSRTVAGRTPVFLDGPGGTQVPQGVVDAVCRYLTTCNANCGGAFTTGRESDALLDQAHRALADFLGAADPGEVV